MLFAVLAVNNGAWNDSIGSDNAVSETQPPMLQHCSL